MKPPICSLCRKRFSPSDGGLVKFSDYEPLPEGTVGHPKGLAWFCPNHLEKAGRLSHLTKTEAIRKLRWTGWLG